MNIESSIIGKCCECGNEDTIKCKSGLCPSCEEKEIIVDDISEITEHKTTRTYDISWGNKNFIVEEVISWNEDGQRNEVIEVVEGETKKENEEVLTWIENNYDKINL